MEVMSPIYVKEPLCSNDQDYYIEEEETKVVYESPKRKNKSNPDK